jgi:hypothetical protein
LQIAEQKEQKGEEELTVKRISAGLQENTGGIRVSTVCPAPPQKSPGIISWELVKPWVLWFVTELPADLTD